MERLNIIDISLSFLVLIFTMKETGFIVNFLVLMLTIIVIFFVIIAFLYLELSRTPRIDYEDKIFTLTIIFTSYFLINTIMNTKFASLSNVCKYFIPLAIVVLIMIPYYLSLKKRIISGKITISYGLKETLEISEDPEDSDDLLISIDNKWKDDIICDIVISCPEEIKILSRNNKESNEIEEPDINVKAHKTFWESFSLQHDGKPGQAEAKINVICKDRNKNKILEKDDKIKLLKLR